MEVHFTSEQEERLAHLAAKSGTDAEQLVKDAIQRLIEDAAQTRRSPVGLPVWDLGAIGPLHRRDIYDDGR